MREKKTAEDIIALNLATVDRALWAIDLLAPADYARTSELIYGGSCGGHFRHIIQHYEAFFTGATSALIDYDLRDRSAPVETDISAARAALQKISRQLQTEPRSDAPLTRVAKLRPSRSSARCAIMPPQGTAVSCKSCHSSFCRHRHRDARLWL
ncbi:MAG: hypothetical protein U1F27_09240 [Turneriella sp.]